MELSRLAATNKRIKDWIRFAETSVQDLVTRQEILSKARSLLEFVGHLWKAGTITQENEKTLMNLERKLESLHEEARLRVVPRMAQHEKVS